MVRTNRFQWSGPLLLLAVAAFLLLNAGWLHMHPDEELSYESTADPSLIATVGYQIELKDNQAPGWFVVFRLWRTLVGDAEYTSRVLGVLTVLLALALLYRIARAGFSSRHAAPLALLVLLGNGLFFNSALDIRPYPLVMLAVACSMWSLQRWQAQPNRRRAIWWGVSIASMLYVHYLLIFVVAAQGVYLVLTMRIRREIALQAALGLIVGGLLFLPWLPVMWSHVQHLRAIEAASGTGRGVAGIGVSTNTTTPENILALVNAATNGLWPVYLALLAVGAWFLRRSCPWWLALAWALLTPTIYLIVNLVAGVYAPRYVAHLTLGLALALGAVFTLLPTWRRVPLGWLAAGGLVAAQMVTLPAQIAVRIPYRDLFGALSAAAQPGDLVYFSQTDPNENLLRWQIGAYLRHDLTVTSEPPAEWPERVWFVTGDVFNPATELEFAALEATHPVQIVHGECTRRWCFVIQLLEAPPLSAAIRFGSVDGVPFRGLTLDSAAANAIAARLWWQVPAGEAPPALDYSIGLQLLDGAGRLVAQADGPITHYGAETVQTSQLEPGRIYMDVRWLALPPDLPAGDYRLQVVVYQSWDGVRLLLPDGSTAYAGPVISLP